MRIRVPAVLLLTFCAAFLVDAAITGTSTPATVAPLVATEPTRGPLVESLRSLDASSALHGTRSRP